MELLVAEHEIKGQVFLPPKNKIKGGLIFCHGIPSGESSNRAQGYDQLSRIFYKKGLVTLFFNFRGTGESGGNFDLQNWVADLREIINYYFQEYGYTPLIITGFSGGAAVAVEAAAQDERVSAVALGSCPANFSFFFELYPPEGVYLWFKQMGLFRNPAELSSQDEWINRFRSLQPQEKIHLLSPRPTLIMHGESDDLVPPDHASTLYNLAGSGKRMVTFPRVGHRLRNSRKALRYLKTWVDEILDKQATFSW